MKNIEVGDFVVCRKTLDCPFPGVNTNVEFKGTVEKIEGEIITVDCGFNTSTGVRKKHIHSVQKKAEVKK